MNQGDIQCKDVFSFVQRIREGRNLWKSSVFIKIRVENAE